MSNQIENGNQHYGSGVKQVEVVSELLRAAADNKLASQDQSTRSENRAQMLVELSCGSA